jgi:MoxR-like ATPase
MQQLVRSVPVERRVIQYAARLVEATHPQNEQVPEIVKRTLRVGVSPRGVQAMIRAGKAEALLDKRMAVSINDIQKVMYPALRHRIILNYEALADGVQPDSILDQILKEVAIPG